MSERLIAIYSVLFNLDFREFVHCICAVLVELTNQLEVDLVDVIFQLEELDVVSAVLEELFEVYLYFPRL